MNTIRRGWALSVTDEKQAENADPECNAVPSENVKRVCLDIAQQPPHGDERNKSGDDETERNHVPVLRRGVPPAGDGVIEKF